MAITKNRPSVSAPTEVAYGEMQAAYDFFNRELFSDELPPCLITFQRSGPHTHGYYSRKRFATVVGERTDEIALNPRFFKNSSFNDLMSTLVHEMCHLWQDNFGKPSRSCYHNRQWAEKMLWLGLHPSDTGQPGGKMTGQRVSHYIIEDGRFSHAVKKLRELGAAVTWHDVDAAPPPPTPEQIAERKAEREAHVAARKAAYAEWLKQQDERNATQDAEEELEAKEEAARLKPCGRSGKRTVYRCPKCSDHAEGKSTLHLICGKCDQRMLRGGLR